jgi:hypothetical protein
MHSTLLQLQLDDELEFQVLLQCLVLSPEKNLSKVFFLLFLFFPYITAPVCPKALTALVDRVDRPGLNKSIFDSFPPPSQFTGTFLGIVGELSPSQ